MYVRAYTCHTPLTFYPPSLPPARAGDPHADSVVVGITCVCVVLLILIILMVTRCYFFRKNIVIIKGVPVVP